MAIQFNQTTVDLYVSWSRNGAPTELRNLQFSTSLICWDRYPRGVRGWVIDCTEKHEI